VGEGGTVDVLGGASGEEVVVGRPAEGLVLGALQAAIKQARPMTPRRALQRPMTM